MPYLTTRAPEFHRARRVARGAKTFDFRIVFYSDPKAATGPETFRLWNRDSITIPKPPGGPKHFDFGIVFYNDPKAAMGPETFRLWNRDSITIPKPPGGPKHFDLAPDHQQTQQSVERLYRQRRRAPVPVLG